MGRTKGMKAGARQDEGLFKEIETLVRSLGCSLVEFQVSRHRGSVQVRLVVYCERGTGTEECSSVHRLVYPRIQVLLDAQDPYLEVASPGIDRILKEPGEFGIFMGRGIRVWTKDASDWTVGRIESYDGVSVAIVNGGNLTKIPLDSVVKARLDFSQEVP
jgi:ribosome maturation factor RimP